MSSVKTFLINDNGEYKIKEHIIKDKSHIKNTLEDKKTQMRMAKLAREAEKMNANKIPEVVQVSMIQKPQHLNYPQNQQNYSQNHFPQNLNFPLQHFQKEQFQIQKPELTVNQTPPPLTNMLTQDEIKRKIQKETDSILKSNGKDTKEEEKQKLLLAKICAIVGIQGHPHGKIIPFDTLNDPQIIKKLFGLQDILKEVFPSSKLTALHSNAIEKQQFPGVNMIRQILKEMGYRLKSINISEGYLGTKKLLRREYQILKL